MTESLQNLKIAVVHDWMFVRRGGEKVLEQILQVFPQADVYYLFGSPQKTLKSINQHNFFPSFLAKVPFVQKFYKLLLPLLPVAIESFDLTKYDVVISSSSCVAKGAICSPHAVHISYIHSPMRYIWDQEHFYFPKPPRLWRPIEIFRRILLNHMRMWDVTATHRVQTLISNSSFVARRCELYYSRQSEVIFPPVELSRFFVSNKKRNHSVLLFGAWVPYKQFCKTAMMLLKNNIAVTAAGSGADLKRLKNLAKNNSLLTVIENPNDAQVLELFQTAGLFLHPAIEDFGITQVEALACGTRVVAPARGGARDILTDPNFGTFYKPFDDNDLIRVVKNTLKKPYTNEQQNYAHEHAKNFSDEKFREKFLAVIRNALKQVKTYHESE